MLRALLLAVFFLPAVAACTLNAGAEDRIDFTVYDSGARRETQLNSTVGAPSRCLDPFEVKVVGDRIVWLEGHTIHILAGGSERTYALPTGTYDDFDLVGDRAYTLSGAKFGRLELSNGTFTPLDLILGTEPAHRFLQEGTAWADHTPTQQTSGDADRYWGYDLEAEAYVTSRTSSQDIGLANGNASLLAANHRFMLVALDPTDIHFGPQRWMHDLVLNRLLPLNVSWQNPILDGDRFYGRAATGWKAIDLLRWVEVPADIRLDRVDAADGNRFVSARFVDLPAPPASSTTSSATTVTVTVTPPREGAPGLGLAFVLVALAFLAARRR